VLASFVITLHSESDVQLPGLGGETLHGLLFDALRQSDAAFATYLHDLDGPRPFSLSGVLGTFPRRQGQVTYDCPPELEPTVRQALHALADFAFYAGVGYKTTMGLGQTVLRALTQAVEEYCDWDNFRHREAGAGIAFSQTLCAWDAPGKRGPVRPDAEDTLTFLNRLTVADIQNEAYLLDLIANVDHDSPQNREEGV
jgi:hypothetical protein